MCAEHRVHLHRLQRRRSLFPRSFPFRVTTRDRRWRRSSARWLASVCMPRYATATPTASRCGSTSMPTFASRAPRCAPPSSLPSPPSPGALPDCISLIASPSPGALAPHSSSLLEPPYLVHISSISRPYLVHISSISHPCLARQIDGEHGWVVAQYTTWHDDKQNKCMQILGVAPPWSSKNASTCMHALVRPARSAGCSTLRPPLPSPPANPPCQPRFMWLLSIACSPRGSMQVLTTAPHPLPLPTGQIWTGKQWDSVNAIRCRPTYHGWGNDAKGTCSNSESSVSPLRTTSPKSDSKRKPKPALV